MLLRPMVKIFVLLLSLFTAVILIGTAWLVTISRSLPDVRFLANPGVSLQITVEDWHGNEKQFVVGPENPAWIPLAGFPAYLRNAVLAGEDFAFYSHNGVDWFELKESFLRNLEQGRYARGASTITQQLAKNLFLTREKTLIRKIREMILARRLEKTLTKDRILELYLNVVELGDMVYGAGQGSLHHFGKDPAALSLRESTLIAAMLPGPKVYNPDQHLDRVMNRSDHLLSVMLKGRMIDNEDYLTALGETPFAPSTADFFPELPVEGEDDFAAQGTAMTTLPEVPDDLREPVPVPIPGYGGAEHKTMESESGI
jgi:monofunctional biosynthetic peptidoglycan transglycosylase